MNDVKELYSIWLERATDDADVLRELKEMEGDEKKITDAFYKDLEFGTGGLRGVIGTGTNRMNIHTVRKASQGYASYLVKNFSDPSVAVAYDSRIKSDVFARAAAEVFAANGIKVYIYPELMPTPSLSFAVRYHKTSGGIVITASHNPSKYNGYKVYGSDGCQITNAAADAILSEIRDTDIFDGIKTLSFEKGLEDGIISWMGEETVGAFISAVSDQSLLKTGTFDKSVSIVYTPLYGAGLKCVTRCLAENGYTNIHIVEEQAAPNGNFPTCPYPNPEIREALTLGLAEAEKVKSDLLIATDPDSDRVGIAVKDKDGYKLITGNEVGLMLMQYISERRREIKTMPEKPVAVKTIVSADLTKAIAAEYGIELREVLTGFKYIGEQIGNLEKDGEADRYILGFEESYGYLTGSYVRDKDAVDGALMIADMFTYYRSKGLTLIEVLDGIYRKYGYSKNALTSYEFEGKEGFDKMQSIMALVRNCDRTSFAGYDLVSKGDYKAGTITYTDGRCEATNLPKSDVLKFCLSGNASFVVRPSGTEPKLKIYTSVSADDPSLLDGKTAELKGELEALFGLN